MNKLTEATLIPLSAAIIAIGGGAAWLTNLNSKMEANAASLESMEKKQDRYSEDVHQIREDISEIKGELKRIIRVP